MRLYWDLHIAIQDAMGWKDTHLHEFKVVHPESGEPSRLGIPDPDGIDERPCTPGWEVPLSDCFGWESLPEGASAHYLYDFGDSWRHLVALEDVLPRGALKSPRCIAGARACPPEDCGGVNGFTEFLEAIADAGHPEHAELLRWVGGSYAPEAFDPAGVKFSESEAPVEARVRARCRLTPESEASLARFRARALGGAAWLTGSGPNCERGGDAWRA